MTAEQAIMKGIEKCDYYIAVNTRLLDSAKSSTDAKLIVGGKLIAYRAVKYELMGILNQIKNEQP
jgi:hypothetical protein